MDAKGRWRSCVLRIRITVRRLFPPLQFKSLGGTSMSRPLCVPVGSHQYTIRESPEPLDGGADFQLDEIDRIIWLAPGLDGRLRERTIAKAVAAAWASSSGLIPVVE